MFLFLLALPALPIVRNTHVVIAHRGDHTALQENTLAAYKKAISDGVDYVEIDLRSDKQGRLVISHNELTAGQQGKLAAFNDVLKLCKGKVNIYLDFKDAGVEVTYRMIRKAHMEKHIVVYANTMEQLEEWRKTAPDMPLLCSVPEEVQDVAGLKAFLDQYPVSAIDGNIGQYSASMLALCKERGVAVWLDVQSKDEGPEKWQRAVDEGVPGMQTDHPQALVQYLKEKSIR